MCLLSDTLPGTWKRVFSKLQRKYLGSRRARNVLRSPMKFLTSALKSIEQRQRIPTNTDFSTVRLGKKMKGAKEDGQCLSVEEGKANGKSKRVHGILRTHANDNLFTENAIVLGRWTEHCRDLSNGKVQPDILQSHHACKWRPNPLLADEVKEAIRAL